MPSESRLLAAIEAIYDAAPEPSRWPQALGIIADCFGDVGALLIWRRDDGSYGTIVSARLVEAQRDYEESGWMRRDIGAIRATERGYFFNGEPYATRDLLSEHEIRSDPSFLQFRARHGLGPFGGVSVSPDAHVGVIISVQRALGRSEFSATCGDISGGMMARLESAVPKAMKVVILQPGGNDLSAELHQRAAARLAAMGVKVLMLPNTMFRGKPHQFDGVHLTPEGHRMLASNWLARLPARSGDSGSGVARVPL